MRLSNAAGRGGWEDVAGGATRKEIFLLVWRTACVLACLLACVLASKATTVYERPRQVAAVLAKGSRNAFVQYFSVHVT